MVSVEAAGADPDILYALASPHMHQLLRGRRGWSVEHCRAWLRNAIIRELLG